MPSSIFKGLCLGLLNVLAAGSALAGGWIGGGGELARDNVNPWYIANTKKVTACIDVDREHFHLPEGKQDLQKDFVDKALAYWRDEMPVDPETKNPLVIGTQTFVFGPCTDDTMLRIQFGVLSPDQRRGMLDSGFDPTHVVSATMRTDYDTENLRGKGFIYIAADSGELRPHTPALFPMPWSDDKGMRLLKVLTHEFGHVYGLPHTPANGTIGQELMNAGYPELVVNQYLANIFGTNLDSIPHFFSEDPQASRYPVCARRPATLSAATAKFFGSPTPFQCLTYTRHGQQIDVGTAPLIDDAHVGMSDPLGTITLSANSRFLISSESLVRIFLTPKQHVLPVFGPNADANDDIGFASYLGPVRQTYGLTGTYQDRAQTLHRHVLVVILPGGEFKISGLTDAGDMLNLLE